MRTPGFEGMYANKGFDSLPWLGRAIANDPRFPKATVAFWWKAVMGTIPVIAPMEMSDADYNDQLALFNAQDKAMSELGEKFMRSGFNAKDLFVEMAMSEWFRSATTTDSNGMVAKVNVGARRLLSVEELEAKIEDVTGVEFNTWRTHDGELEQNKKILTSTQQFRIAGGGGDMVTVKNRAEKTTTLIANTAEMAAMRMMCGAVISDFNTNGVMFRGIDRNTTDPTKLKNKIVELYDRFLGEKLTTTSSDVVETYALLTAAAKERRDTGMQNADWGVGCMWQEDEGWLKYNNKDPKGMMYAWSDVVTLLMMDYKFIHE